MLALASPSSSEHLQSPKTAELSDGVCIYMIYCPCGVSAVISHGRRVLIVPDMDGDVP